MEFFTKAKEYGWLCDEIVTEKFPVSILFNFPSTIPQSLTVLFLSQCSPKTQERKRFELPCMAGALLLRKKHCSYAYIFMKCYSGLSTVFQSSLGLRVSHKCTYRSSLLTCCPINHTILDLTGHSGEYTSLLEHLLSFLHVLLRYKCKCFVHPPLDLLQILSPTFFGHPMRAPTVVHHSSLDGQVEHTLRPWATNV
jgi:hypothetical protein